MFFCWCYFVVIFFFIYTFYRRVWEKRSVPRNCFLFNWLKQNTHKKKFLYTNLYTTTFICVYIQIIIISNMQIVRFIIPCSLLYICICCCCCCKSANALFHCPQAHKYGEEEQRNDWKWFFNMSARLLTGLVRIIFLCGGRKYEWQQVDV